MTQRQALAKARGLWGQYGTAVVLLDVLYRVGYTDSRGEPNWLGTGTSFEAAFEDAQTRFSRSAR